MQHKNYNEIKEAIAELEVCRDTVGIILDIPDIAPIKARLINDLNRQIKYLKMQVGELDTALIPHIEHAPLTRMFGRDIVVDKNKPKEDLENKLKRGIPTLSPTEVEEKELKAKVEELLPKFRYIENESIIDSYSDLEIRGVAKRAGLPVTETDPKNINTGYVQKIKDALSESERLKAEGNPENKVDDAEKAAIELSQKVDVILPLFPELKNEKILSDYSDLEIRAVAKRAGLPVTEEEPAKIDSKFVTLIKNTITKKAD